MLVLFKYVTYLKAENMKSETSGVSLVHVNFLHKLKCI